MTTNSLHSFITSAADGEQGIIHTGDLGDSWIDEYYLKLTQAREEWSSQIVFPQSMFKSFHYVSIHLPLCYRVWSISTGRRNTATEHALTLVLFETETFLWSCLCSPSKWIITDGVSDACQCDHNDSRLIELCFGNSAPVIVTGDEMSAKQWKQEYEQRLTSAHRKWRSEQLWPQILCMAVHFASLYIDLFQMRDITQLTRGSNENRQLQRIDQLIDRLKDYIQNTDVLGLIRIWLESMGAARDSGGVPQIAPLRKEIGRSISVRTISEVFLAFE